jgi:alpha-galactosidase
MTQMTDAPVVHLRGGGTSVVVSLTNSRLPRILHWGEDLGELTDVELTALDLASRPTIGDSTVTYPQPVPVIAQLSESWLGKPGISGSRRGRAWAPLFDDAKSTVTFSDDRTTLVTESRDSEYQLGIRIEIELFKSGIVRARATVTNDGEPYRLETLELALPVPDAATELMDFTGRWALERIPQRQPFNIGAWNRESRGGKPGLDHSTVLLAGVSGFGFRAGKVWGIHLGWSGNQVVGAERSPAGTRVLRGGEIILPDEVVLLEGQSYESPWLYGSWGEGLDDFSSRFHQYVRSRPNHPRSPRPVLVNTWEAVYFHHELPALIELAEKSAELGAERFVLDDGWFLDRRDDTSSLGDWVVDPSVWPDGLAPLSLRVHELGMEFGLWFEPEMINLNSELAREHPEWIFDAGHGPGAPSRYQHVLDLGHPAAWELAFQRISGLVDQLHIDFIKWDHNRYLTDAGHSPGGEPGVSRHTHAAYRMMDALHEAHPGLEIESCASGGGRIDLGVLERSERVWPSDCNDPHDRLEIQKWTGLLLPPELQGTHIGAEDSHTTHRVSTLDFRAATAVWGNLGVELDLRLLDEVQFADVKRWVEFHKEHRRLLHSGTAVHADSDPSVRLEGVVAQDGSEALYQFAVIDRPAQWPPNRLRFPGLDPDRHYRVALATPGAAIPEGQRPPWMISDIQMSGASLANFGIEAPSLDVDHSALFILTKVE